MHAHMKVYVMAIVGPRTLVSVPRSRMISSGATADGYNLDLALGTLDRIAGQITGAEGFIVSAAAALIPNATGHEQ